MIERKEATLSGEKLEADELHDRIARRAINSMRPEAVWTAMT
jgi:hypothetical protein